MENLKNYLNPKNLMIAVGICTIIISIWGMVDGEEWAKAGWGEENVLGHDAAYEKMWALHMMPLGVLAIGTGLFVTGKSLAKMAMLSPAVVVIIGGGMGYYTTQYDYGGPSGLATLIPVLTILLVILLGVSGYLHKDDEKDIESA